MKQHGMWCWFDVLAPTALVVLVAVLAVHGARIAQARREAAEREHERGRVGPCDWAPGQPCGCDPVHGPCQMPCAGCCGPEGCAAHTPPPTSSQ